MVQDTLETAQHFIFVTQVYFCAMYAVVIWDWVISLPREYRFIWRTSITPVKCAYLFCRYWVIATVPYLLYCFVMDHTWDECERIYKIPVALALWNQAGSESVLLIRTYAFFNRSRLVLGLLCMALGGVIAYQLYVDTSQMLVLQFVTPPFQLGPCFPESKPHSAHLLGFFIAPLLFDTVVTSMTVWKAIQIRRRNGGPSSRLIQTFLREGVFYYLLISIANLINGIFYLQPRQVISAINIPLSVMLSPVLACRLILDLRERGAETIPHSEGTIPAFTTSPNRIFGLRFRADSNNSGGSPPRGLTSHGSRGNLGSPTSNLVRSHPRAKTTTINSGVMLTTIGSVNVGVTTTTRTASSLGHGHGHGHGYERAIYSGPEGGMGGVGENAMEMELDVADELRYQTRSKSKKEREQEMEDEAAFRAVEMSLGIGLGGAVDGIRVDVEKMSDAI
ncbi:uncharacterized protein STEHIDRAFT_151533 [Stereum hirsutum FP-91666 SS1]|uniref:uncharacterized protein n=1 Tax=Stereum hirsutum (strain FP-91666) TaxID=721885 RepID=UPI000440E65B|nr:uncharacterized protein STEHIDRAFT_151533 [Stereum hirsutum FP-91666 SS1]EIM92195.1 hypothetical protein STEHIDRAFT_151533 [Stereum hirsutum FP-91666 SS1]